MVACPVCGGTEFKPKRGCMTCKRAKDREYKRNKYVAKGPAMPNRKHLTNEQKAYIDANWPNMSRYAMANEIGKNESTVRKYCIKMGYERQLPSIITTYEGKPCPHGHTLRYIVSKRCVDCDKAHVMRYRRKLNPKRKYKIAAALLYAPKMGDGYAAA